jgi:hypothetical protein
VMGQLLQVVKFGCTEADKSLKTLGPGNVKACVVTDHSHQISPTFQKNRYRGTST